MSDSEQSAVRNREGSGETRRGSTDRPGEEGADGTTADERAATLREAEVALGESDFDAMGIGALVDLFRAANIQDFEELVCRGDGAVVQVRVQEQVDRAALSGLDPVENWTYVTGSGGDHVYVVEFTAPHLPADLADEFDDLVGNCDPELGERGATMSLVGEQATISAAVAAYRRSGVSPALRKLGGYDGGTAPLDDLTDRQREVIRTAYELGHYEVPSEASTADVAAELGLDDSTVAEHLQRAERNLLARHFG